MNDKDKEALENYRKLFHGNMAPRNDDYGNRDAGFRNGWQAACQYKEAENKKLREALAEISLYVSYNGCTWVQETAREALKEVGEK
jgi:hypothetical protein